MSEFLTAISTLFAEAKAERESLDRAIHARLDHLHEKSTLALHAMSLFIEKGFAMSPAFEAIKSEIADMSSEVDQLISAKNDADAKAASDADAAAADIKAALDAVKAKVAGALAPAAPPASTAPAPAVPAAPVTVTVTDPVPAGSDTIPVSTPDPVAVGSTVSGDSVALGTTVTASDASSITVSPSTTDDHVAGDTIAVVPPSA